MAKGDLQKKLCRLAGHQQKLGDFSNRQAVVVNGKPVIICMICGDEVKK